MLKKFFIAVLASLLTTCGVIKSVKLAKAGKVRQQKYKVEVPFEMRMGLIILKVTVNGVPCDFMLDTGAPNVLSQELAQKLNLVPVSSHKVGDSQGGKGQLDFIKVSNINIGGIDFDNTGAAIADLGKSTEVACLKIDGLIGSNLMRKAVWQFDYEKKIITISDKRNAFDIPATAVKVKFKPLITGTPVTDLSVNGMIEKDVLIDLGSNGGIHLTKALFDKLRVTPNPTVTYSFGHDAAGLFGRGAADTTYYFAAKEFKIGSSSLSSVPVSFKKGTVKTIGTDFFKNYRLIFDWGLNELTLISVKPYEELTTPRFKFKKLLIDEKMKIGLIFADNETGLQLGDQILEINGHDYRKCDPVKCWCESLMSSFDGDVVSVLISRAGNEMRLDVKKELLFKAK